MRAPLQRRRRRAHVVVVRGDCAALAASPDRADRRRPCAASSAAASATVRAIGPAVSCVCAIGMMPRAAHEADRRLDADEAVRRRRADDRAVGLGADADRARGWPRSPRRSRSSSRTGCDRARTDCCVWPPRPLQPLVECVERKFAHSLRFVLPRITAPGVAQPRDDERVARARRDPPSASEPAVVVMRSAVSMLSLISTGMPCSGPRASLRACARRRARRRSSSASGLISITDRSAGPGRSSRSMRSR